MGLYEDLLDRIRPVAESAGFPAALPASERDPWDMPRLSDLPQTLLPPHLRKKTLPAVDASSIGVQSALGNQPDTTPGLPAAFQTAGMLPSLNPNEPVGLTAAEKAAQALAGGGAPSAPVPMPQARPADASAEPLPEPIPMAAAPGSPPSATDFSSQSRAPLQIAPPAAAPAPAVGMVNTPGASMFDRIRSTLGDNSNTLLALGAGFAGAPNWGQAISRAASAAIPARAADIRQTLDRTSRGYGTSALIEAGVPVQQAIAASADPELKKALIQQYIVDRKGQIIDIGFDRYGQPIKGIFDPYTKKITPVSSGMQSSAEAPAAGGAPVAGTGTSTDISSQKAGAPNPVAVGSGIPVTAENDITGPDYLQRLKETDPMYARQVEQVLNGDAPMPTGRSAKTATFDRKLRQDVLTIEPGATDSDFQTRNMVRKSYSGGNDAKITKSINTTLKHAGTLEKAINDLDNFSTAPVLNYPRSLIEGQTSEKYRTARAAYETAVANFAKELDFTVSGGRPTVSGTKHQMEGFDVNAAKDAQLEKLKTGVELLKGRLDSHASGYAKGLKKAVEPIDFVDPGNRKIYKRLVGDDVDPTGIAVPGVAEAPATAAPSATPAAPPAKGSVKIGDQVIPWSVN